MFSFSLFLKMWEFRITQVKLNVTQIIPRFVLNLAQAIENRLYVLKCLQ